MWGVAFKRIFKGSIDQCFRHTNDLKLFMCARRWPVISMWRMNMQISDHNAGSDFLGWKYPLPLNLLTVFVLIFALPGKPLAKCINRTLIIGFLIYKNLLFICKKWENIPRIMLCVRVLFAWNRMTNKKEIYGVSRIVCKYKHLCVSLWQRI